MIDKKLKITDCIKSLHRTITIAREDMPKRIEKKT